MNIIECQKILQDNPGVVILKFSANWCAPCSKIEPVVKFHLKNLPKNTNLYRLDVDDNIELYSFFKNKIRLNGIPAFLAFYKGNVTHIPNDMIIGANIPELNLFFQRCIEHV